MTDRLKDSRDAVRKVRVDNPVALGFCIGFGMLLFHIIAIIIFYIFIGMGIFAGIASALN